MPVQALAGGLAPSSLYGGEHLLRALQRLPALLPTGGLAPAALASIEAGLAHFLKFLLRHQARPSPFAHSKFSTLGLQTSGLAVAVSAVSASLSLSTLVPNALALLGVCQRAD